MRIGFIGLGHMGLPMALNLLQAGHEVCGFDLNPEACQQFADKGGRIAEQLANIAEQELIITMLQKGSQVQEVCEAPAGIFAKAAKDLLFIDCSTIDVATSQQLHALAKAKGIVMVDAPVSGGVAGAIAASLTFMVGGEKSAFARVEPLLAVMGKKIIYTGGDGSGVAAKICNNHLLGISMIAVSEAFILAKKLGLSDSKLLEVVTNASGNCWVMQNYVPVPNLLEKVPANKGYEPGFTAVMMLKDLLLAEEAAQYVQVETPMGAKATELYQQLVEKGKGHLDFSAIIQLLS